MTHPDDFGQPPRIAAWLVNLFASNDDAGSILGDLQEEFHEHLSKSGMRVARGWYWRQCAKTIPCLVGAGFRATPWLVAAAIAGGWLLTRLIGPLPGEVTAATLHKYRVYEHHVDAYMFWITHGMLFGRVIMAALIGGIIAMVVKGREMTATTAFALFQVALGVPTALVNAVTTGDPGFLWTIPWMLAFSTAAIFGGAVVRTRRQSAPTAA